MSEFQLPNEHPDFWQLCQLALKREGRSSEDRQSALDMVRDIVDVDSLIAVAEARCGHLASSQLHLPTETMEAVLGVMIGLYLDAFLLGHAFKEAS